VGLSYAVDTRGFVRSLMVRTVMGHKDIAPAAIRAFCASIYIPPLDIGEPRLIEDQKLRVSFELDTDGE
jgi:hypothetical protein